MPRSFTWFTLTVLLEVGCTRAGFEGLFSPCSASSECPNGMACSGGVCLRENGQACHAPAECVSACIGAVCRPTPIVEPVYPNSRGWNDYVVNNGGLVYAQSGAACLGSEAGGPRACLHAGELRKVVVSGEASCAGLTAVDTLGAFQWVCADASGSASFFSVALKPERGLRDLVTDGGFRRDSVRVQRGPSLLFETEPAVWWTNNVLPLPDNSSGSAVQLTAAGTIYVLAADRATAGYDLNADKLAIVVTANATLSSSTGFNILFAGSINARFLWIEGNFDAKGNSSSMHLRVTSFLVLRHTRAQNGDNGLILADSNAASVSNLVIGNTRNYGAIINNTRDSVFSGLFISNVGNGVVGQAGLLVESGSTSNVFSQVLAQNASEYGLLLAGGAGNIYSHVTTANNGYSGFTTAESNTVVVQTVSGNNNSLGFEMESTNTRLANVVATDNADVGFYLNGSSNNLFSGVLVAGNNGIDCSVTGGTSPGLDNTCVSGATRILGPSLATSFANKVMVDDAVNPTDSAGTQQAGVAGDWTHQESAFRGWGQDGSVFPASDNRFSCQAGTCRLWDWRLAGTDTVLLRHSGGGAVANESFTAGTPCPAAVHGDRAILGQGAGYFLINALERFGDGIGDEDGLCESNETCLYSPNLGAWQGDGSASTASCSFSAGLVTGVTMLDRQ